MKIGFITSVLTLFTTSSVFAEISFIDYHKKNYGNDIDNNVLIKCSNIIEEYQNECIGSEIDSFSKNKIDGLCDRYNSEKCQYLFEDIDDTLKECKKLPENEYNNIIEYFNETSVFNELYCTKNESNENCPIIDLDMFTGTTLTGYILNGVMLNSTFPSEENYKNVINNTCRSKKCNDALYKFVYFFGDENQNSETITRKNTEENSNKFLEFRKSVIAILKSDNCTALGNESQEHIANGVTKTQISVGFIVATLSLFLVLLNDNTL
ncbi:hypothetical protein BCR36DRAFT_580491 [Piromyces finnis]|uniref:Uncharacterized protein n=1 Tax=Piromyces finnis TaxID=1754191 RepID=A0A1Y1VKP2_9FUNG|nr:hypothetical protein BCR36DRAFT_580491 [Piromyces finnis]|eukprot:ORX57938.1 hypothetical protein BCR36DRAFT_580491 [Piromyces finnis]